MSEPTSGIPNPDKPGSWIVPPWPLPARLHDTVSHFLRFSLRDDASVTEKLAYYKGYLTALEAAPTHELRDNCGQRWYEDLCRCIGRCVAMYQDKRAADIQRAKGNVRSLPPTARAAPADPTFQERAS